MISEIDFSITTFVSSNGSKNHDSVPVKSHLFNEVKSAKLNEMVHENSAQTGSPISSFLNGDCSKERDGVAGLKEIIDSDKKQTNLSQINGKCINKVSKKCDNSFTYKTSEISVQSDSENASNETITHIKLNAKKSISSEDACMNKISEDSLTTTDTKESNTLSPESLENANYNSFKENDTSVQTVCDSEVICNDTNRSAVCNLEDNSHSKIPGTINVNRNKAMPDGTSTVSDGDEEQCDLKSNMKNPILPSNINIPDESDSGKISDTSCSESKTSESFHTVVGSETFLDDLSNERAKDTVSPTVSTDKKASTFQACGDRSSLGKSEDEISDIRSYCHSEEKIQNQADLANNKTASKDKNYENSENKNLSKGIQGLKQSCGKNEVEDNNVVVKKLPKKDNNEAHMFDNGNLEEMVCTEVANVKDQIDKENFNEKDTHLKKESAIKLEKENDLNKKINLLRERSNEKTIESKCTGGKSCDKGKIEKENCSRETTVTENVICQSETNKESNSEHLILSDNCNDQSEAKKLDSSLTSADSKSVENQISQRNANNKRPYVEDSTNPQNVKKAKTSEGESCMNKELEKSEGKNKKFMGTLEEEMTDFSMSDIKHRSDITTSPNQLYQGLLNDILLEEKDMTKEPEVVRTKLQRIKRKDLEDMIIDQLTNKLLYDHELGYQKELCKRLEQTLEAANKRALKLTQEVESLRNIANKVATEHRRRKMHLIHPTKIKRSVGIQANKVFISQGFSSAMHPGSDVRIVTPSKYQKLKRNNNTSERNGEKYGSSSTSLSGKLRQRGRMKSDMSLRKKIKEEVQEETDEEEYAELESNLSEKINTLKNNLESGLLEEENQSTSSKWGYKYRKSSINGKLRFEESLRGDMYLSRKTEGIRPRHPAPLPRISCEEEDILNGRIPPEPLLRVHLKNKSIILSWNIQGRYDEKSILSYQLFSYEETKALPTTSLWQKIGSVKALELPMACTLTQFKCGKVYHFAVRAMTKKGRIGPFSQPKSLRMPLK